MDVPISTSVGITRPFTSMLTLIGGAGCNSNNKLQANWNPLLHHLTGALP